MEEKKVVAFNKSKSISGMTPDASLEVLYGRL
jgi:hypothetical protein